jgi:hypothetical protein
MEQIVVLMVDLGQNHVSPPLLIVKLETLAFSWAISNVHALLTFTFTWDKWVILDQI